MRLEPTLNRIIVRPTTQEKKSNAAGLIVIEDKKQGIPEMGTVVSVGPGGYHPKTGELIPMTVVVGDMVLFSKLSGQVIAFGESEVVSIFEHDIIGIVRN
jgi:chaperonin GroES